VHVRPLWCWVWGFSFFRFQNRIFWVL